MAMENQLVFRYLDDLKDNISDEIGCHNKFILSEAQNLAIKAEFRLNHKRNSRDESS